MQKLEIAKRIHTEVGISEVQATRLLDWILELLKATLHKGERIIVPNFGVFTVRSKAPRMGRNVRTGEAIMISPRRVVTFRASPYFKAHINGVQTEVQEEKSSERAGRA
jgi:integration host factor subunit alpha